MEMGIWETPKPTLNLKLVYLLWYLLLLNFQSWSGQSYCWGSLVLGRRKEGGMKMGTGMRLNMAPAVGKAEM